MEKKREKEKEERRNLKFIIIILFNLVNFLTIPNGSQKIYEIVNIMLRSNVKSNS